MKGKSGNALDNLAPCWGTYGKQARERRNNSNSWVRTCGLLPTKSSVCPSKHRENKLSAGISRVVGWDIRSLWLKVLRERVCVAIAIPVHMSLHTLEPRNPPNVSKRSSRASPPGVSKVPEKSPITDFVPERLETPESCVPGQERTNKHKYFGLDGVQDKREPCRGQTGPTTGTNRDPSQGQTATPPRDKPAVFCSIPQSNRPFCPVCFFGMGPGLSLGRLSHKGRQKNVYVFSVYCFFLAPKYMAVPIEKTFVFNFWPPRKAPRNVPDSFLSLL